jgi:hypothetical protein
MANPWRHVSALMILVALVAAACGSEPTAVVVGDDGDDVVADVVEDASALDEEADPETDSTGAVADDSAPVLTDLADFPPETQRALKANAASRDLWLSHEISDYDYTIEISIPGERALLQLEVRDGEVLRRLATSQSTNKNAWPIRGLFPQIDEAIREQLPTSVEYDGHYGFPTQLVVDLPDGDGYLLEIHRFQMLDAYPETCTASTLDYPLPNGDDAVATTWAGLLEASQACDFLMLASLADEGTEPLTTSFGGGGVELLWEAEANGDPRLGILAELLSSEPGFTEDGMAVWPKEFADPDSQYLDWRVGIAADGEWLYFVAGD